MIFHKLYFINLAYNLISLFAFICSFIAINSSLAASVLELSKSEEDFSNLITNNPFVQKTSITKTPSGPSVQINKTQILQKYLEYRSIVIIDEKKYFSIYNKRTNKNFWIAENEAVESLRISSYNPTENSITITDGVNTEILKIISANETPLRIANTPSQDEKAKKAPPPVPETSEIKKNSNKSKPIPRRRVIPIKK